MHTSRIATGQPQELLGICVTRQSSWGHLKGITEAAFRSGKRVEIFITGEAAKMTQEPGFVDLLAMAEISICEVSYIAAGYQGLEIPGLRDRDFVTQMKNAELVEKSDRYLLL